MNEIFAKYKDMSIGVLGDFCLDEYLWIDAALNEPSLETELIAYQCTKRETSPGAAGTVAKNLVNLGVGKVYAIGVAGDDGRGHELCRHLDKLGINRDSLTIAADRVTPTYTKPWIIETDGSKREMSRIDTKNWTPTPPDIVYATLKNVKNIINSLDALIIMDQMTEDNCGIITESVRGALYAFAVEYPSLLIFADSRSRIGLFDGIMVKGNKFELTHAVYGMAESNRDASVKLAADPSVARSDSEVHAACINLSKKNGHPVICTLGEKGVRIYNADNHIDIPGIEIEGQIDVCGAGDMFTAAFVSSLAAGGQIEDGAKIGNIAAALCIKQLGSTGYVTAEDIINFKP